MGNSNKIPISRGVPTRLKVTGNKIRIGISGTYPSHHTGRARKLVDLIIKNNPNEYEDWFYFEKRWYGERFYWEFLENLSKEFPDEAQQLKCFNHKNSPFLWLEHPDGRMEAIGGRDMFCEWIKKNDALKAQAYITNLLGEPWTYEAYFDNTNS